MKNLKFHVFQVLCKNGHICVKGNKKVEKNEETEAWTSPSILGESPKIRTPPFVVKCEALNEEDKEGDEWSNQSFAEQFP